MSAVTIILLTIALFVGSVLTAAARAVLTGEIKGLANDALVAAVRRTDRLLPPGLAEDQVDEWLEELEAMKERPVTALKFVRGLSRAARCITAEVLPELGGATISDVTKLKVQMIESQQFEKAANMRNIERAWAEGINLPPEAGRLIADARASLRRSPLDPRPYSAAFVRTMAASGAALRKDLRSLRQSGLRGSARELLSALDAIYDSCVLVSDEFVTTFRHALPWRRGRR